MRKWMILVLAFCLLAAGCGKGSGDADATTALGPGESYVYSIDEGAFSAYISGKVIEPEQIGGKLSDVRVTAGWKNNTDGAWLSQEQLRAEVYEISGIETKTAVAVKFIDKGDALTTTHYYVILNPQSDLSALEAYVIPPPLRQPGDE